MSRVQALDAAKVVRLQTEYVTYRGASIAKASEPTLSSSDELSERPSVPAAERCHTSRRFSRRASHPNQIKRDHFLAAESDPSLSAFRA